VPKKFLDDSDIYPISKKKRGNRVSQHMRSDMALYAGISAKLGNDIGHTLGRKALARCVHEECLTLTIEPSACLKMLRLNLDRVPINHKTESMTTSLASYSESRVRDGEVLYVQ